MFNEGMGGVPEKHPGVQEKYEPLIWDRADKLSVHRKKLEERAVFLYNRVSEMNSRLLKLHESDELAQMEVEYWNIKEKLGDIKKREDDLENLLIELQEGRVGEEELQEMFPPKETKGLSKRKQRIQEEIDTLGYDPRDRADSISQGFNSDARIITTGRGKTGIKGSINPIDAEREFYLQTADTHGGKSRKQKKKSYYTTRGGKRIQKR